MHQALQGTTFHVEHVRPRSRGGASSLENLAWCCPSCNLHKADRIDVIDPESGEVARLFHPRLDAWADHFVWEGCRVAGRTATGRATALALGMNEPRRIAIRRAEERIGLFPPAPL